MIDGTWWLVILLVVVVALWLLARSRGPNNSDKDKKTMSLGAKTPINDALQKTLLIIKQHFPEYRVMRKGNHLLITKQSKKIAMITIDKSIAAGQRRLGDVPVINYHRVPSRAQLSTNLQNTG